MQRATGAKGAVNAKGSGSALGVVECHEVEVVEGTEEVRSEGTGEVLSKICCLLSMRFGSCGVLHVLIKCCLNNTWPDYSRGSAGV